MASISQKVANGFSTTLLAAAAITSMPAKEVMADIVLSSAGQNPGVALDCKVTFGVSDGAKLSEVTRLVSRRGCVVGVNRHDQEVVRIDDACRRGIPQCSVTVPYNNNDVQLFRTVRENVCQAYKNHHQGKISNVDVCDFQEVRTGSQVAFLGAVKCEERVVGHVCGVVELPQQPAQCAPAGGGMACGGGAFGGGGGGGGFGGGMGAIGLAGLGGLAGFAANRDRNDSFVPQYQAPRVEQPRPEKPVDGPRREKDKDIKEELKDLLKDKEKLSKFYSEHRHEIDELLKDVYGKGSSPIDPNNSKSYADLAREAAEEYAKNLVTFKVDPDYLASAPLPSDGVLSSSKVFEGLGNSDLANFNTFGDQSLRINGLANLDANGIVLEDLRAEVFGEGEAPFDAPAIGSLGGASGVTAVPEPSTLALTGLAAGAYALFRRRFKSK